MQLDLSSLHKAIAQLQESLNYYHSDLVQGDPALIRQLRAAAIQAFEYNYELSIKMLKRYLELAEPSKEIIDQMSFPTLIRTASERGLLLNDWSIWKQYREARNITSHTYDEEFAERVFATIPSFLDDANYLLNKLENAVGNA